jgi:Flp pilus assembly protein CpaB
VLAVGSDVGASDTKAGSNGRAVTVSLTPEQAQLVTHAQSQGQLDVVLRNPEDIVVLKDLPETTSSDIREPERRQRFATRPVIAPQEGAVREIDQVQ